MTVAQKQALDEQELSETQWQCIEHLIAGKTKTAAAEAVGVARFTVTRWFQDETFVAALNARRLDVQEANVERLRSLTERALAVFEDALDDPNPKVRLQAATQLLNAATLAAVPPPSTPAKQDEGNKQMEQLFELIDKIYGEKVEEVNGATAAGERTA
jgi:hypothetical protein